MICVSSCSFFESISNHETWFEMDPRGSMITLSLMFKPLLNKTELTDNAQLQKYKQALVCSCLKERLRIVHNVTADATKQVTGPIATMDCQLHKGGSMAQSMLKHSAYD